MVSLGRLGAAAAVGLAATGSSLGVGAAGPAAVGAWKKCYAQDKAAPFVLFAFIGAPMSQTIYGMILMGWINTALDASLAAHQVHDALADSIPLPKDLHLSRRDEY